MNIGIDMMGGDFAPRAVVLGVSLVSHELPADVHLTLIGDENAVKEIFVSEGIDYSKYRFVHTTEVIEMGEQPSKAFTKKPNSSIARGFSLLKTGEIDGFTSAGNTGAMLAGAMFTVKPIPGILRPSIPVVLPRFNYPKPFVLLDVGLNPDAKPEVLYQYGILGKVFAQKMLQILDPKVALLNIGSEPEKGNIVAKATYDLMKNSQDFSFIGNFEGYDLFDNPEADVIVCDGFVGNIIIKLTESIFSISGKCGIQNNFFDQFNYEVYGGTPILGINTTVFIGHGVSSPLAIKNTIQHTCDMVNAHLPETFNEIFK